MYDWEFGKLTKFCFPGFGQKQGFFRKDSSLLLLNFSLQMSKFQDTNWDGPQLIGTVGRSEPDQPGEIYLYPYLLYSLHWNSKNRFDFRWHIQLLEFDKRGKCWMFYL